MSFVQNNPKHDNSISEDAFILHVMIKYYLYSCDRLAQGKEIMKSFLQFNGLHWIAGECIQSALLELWELVTMEENLETKATISHQICGVAKEG